MTSFQSSTYRYCIMSDGHGHYQWRYMDNVPEGECRAKSPVFQSLKDAIEWGKGQNKVEVRLCDGWKPIEP